MTDNTPTAGNNDPSATGSFGGAGSAEARASEVPGKDAVETSGTQGEAGEGAVGASGTQGEAGEGSVGASGRQGEGARLSINNLTVGYRDKPIIEGLSTSIPTGSFTVIVGPNACGKSTLLKAISRMLEPTGGAVELDGKDITSYQPKEVARNLSLLPQSPSCPEGIVVEDLVARGRYPHQGLFKQWSDEDERQVKLAMAKARVEQLKDRYVSELSGGQRQRVWISLVLAQNAPIVLLDEPTTYLDITHQVEVLNIARDLQREGFTVVAVLHELTLAFRYATNLIMMKEGAIVAEGAVNDVVTEDLIQQVYNLNCHLLTDPHSGRPIVVPVDE